MLVVITDGDKESFLDTRNGEIEEPAHYHYGEMVRIGAVVMQQILLPRYYIEMCAVGWKKIGWNPKSGYLTYEDAFRQMEKDILKRKSRLEDDDTVYRIVEEWS